MNGLFSVLLVNAATATALRVTAVYGSCGLHLVRPRRMVRA